MARAQPPVRSELAEYYAQEALPGGCRRFQGGHREVRQILQPQSRRTLKPARVANTRRRRICGGDMRPSAGMRSLFMVSSSWCCCLLTVRAALLIESRV